MRYSAHRSMPTNVRLSTLALLLGVFLLGCDPAEGLDVPPLVAAPSPELPGKFVSHTLVTTEPESARTFYGLAFGWEFEVVGDGRYTLVMSEGRRIAGILDITGWRGAPRATAWLAGVSVPHVDTAVAKAKSMGAQQLENILDIPHAGRVALLADLEGAPFLVVRARGGDPVDEPSLDRIFAWDELDAHDTDGAARFYQQVFGYRIEQVDGGVPPAYLVLSRDGSARAGIREVRDETTAARWTPHVHVRDPRGALARIETLGGTIASPPRARLDGRVTAYVVDPMGGHLAVDLPSDSPAAESSSR